MQKKHNYRTSEQLAGHGTLNRDKYQSKPDMICHIRSDIFDTVYEILEPHIFDKDYEDKTD